MYVRKSDSRAEAQGDGCGEGHLCDTSYTSCGQIPQCRRSFLNLKGLMGLIKERELSIVDGHAHCHSGAALL